MHNTYGMTEALSDSTAAVTMARGALTHSERLNGVAALRNALAALEDESILAARFDGETFASIAAALGVTKQRVHQRWTAM